MKYTKWKQKSTFCGILLVVLSLCLIYSESIKRNRTEYREKKKLLESMIMVGGQSQEPSGFIPMDSSTSNSNPLEQRVFRPKTTNKEFQTLNKYEIDYENPPQTPEGMRRYRFALNYGARGKITLKVVNSKGKVVPDAKVHVWLWDGSLTHCPKVDTYTDESGLVSIEGKSKGYFEFSVQKEGYYSTRWKYMFLRRYRDCVENGKWIPWNPTLEVVLKEARNQERLSLYTDGIRSRKIPGESGIGYDVVKKDFVAPYGSGEYSDFTLLYEVEPITPSNRRDYSWKAQMKIEKGGGIARKTKELHSRLHYVYDGNDVEYTDDSVLWYFEKEGEKWNSERLQSHEYLVLRTRVKRDDSGQIVSALYTLFERLEIHPKEKDAMVLMTYFYNDKGSNLELAR